MMTKTEILDKCSRNGEERTLLGRILDKRELSEKRSCVSSSPFLSPEEQALCSAMLHLCGSTPLFYGGYEYAERQVCLFLPEWMEEIPDDEDNPLSAVRAEFPKSAQLSHRDFLGSIMGLGITREKIGDILPGEGWCDVLVLREAAPILLSQWESAGRQSLRVSEISLKDLRFTPPQVKVIHDTVASLRLDSALSSAFSISRSKAAELIASGKASLNHRECLKADKAIVEGDILSCRGYGKAVIKEAGSVSKKGRIILTIERYI